MIIASIAAHLEHLKKIIKHPLIDELRFNTIVPVLEEKSNLLKNLKKKCGNKLLWIDLITRQLFINKVTQKRYISVKINKKISIKVPFKLFYRQTVVQVIDIIDGDTLIFSQTPFELPEPGEIIKIIDNSLVVEDFFSQNDIEYINSAKKCGIHNYMLSFVESEEDIRKLLDIDPWAIIIAKIESQKGLAFVKKNFPPEYTNIRLLATQDHLLVQSGDNKTRTITALKIIVKKDPEAIVSSQILSALEKAKEISVTDFSDLMLLKVLGYHNFLLNDNQCFNKNIFEQVMLALKEYVIQFKKE